MAVPRPPDPDSLAALLVLAAAGEHAAFARVIRVRHEALTRLAAVVTADPATAAQAVRDAWPEAWRALRDGTAPADPDAWLARHVVAEALHLAQHAGSAGALGSGAGRPADPGPTAGAPPPPDLERIPAGDRAAFALRHVARVDPAPPTGRNPLARLRRRRTDRGLVRAEARLDPALVRAWAAGIRVPPVSADETARRAAAEVRLERGRRLSVAVGAVAGLLVAAAPYLLPLLAGR